MTKKIILLISVLIIFGCKAHKQLATENTAVTEDITVIHEKLIPVKLPVDSAVIRARFECDSNYNVVLKELKELKSKNIQASFDYVNGLFEYKLRSGGDTVHIPGKDYIKRIKKTIVIKKTVTITKTIKVEKKFNTIQKTQLFLGTVSIYAIIIGLIYIILKNKSTLLKVFIKLFSLLK